MPSDVLAGRTALVTGAGSGLGRAISLSYAEQGLRLVLVGRDKSTLDSVAKEIAALPGPAATPLVRICDVSDEAAVAQLAASIASVDVSILVNNAGIPGPTNPLVDLELADWEQVFATNVRGVFLMCRAFLPRLIARGGGDVINLSSVSGKRPLVNRTPYTASKMALIGLTATLAFEVGPHGVMVNTLSPGYVDSERMHGNFRRAAALDGRTYEQVEAEFVGRAALGRMVTEQEVGQAAVAMLTMPGLCGADIDLSAGMIAR
ncbi:MAG TPA: SDR family oxidoreductase [Pseudonocardiaceae bacterium]|jgi:NAD(P)-dependent dehydrogenase (short-subunit alcohol dehydrogenase family)|nr:SDR family oxidoreductase [Pseudonocardiaceae bacterium]